MRPIKITDNCIIYNDMDYGWKQGKGQPKWHNVIFRKWESMWKRVYTELNWFGRTIQPEYKYLSKYVDDIKKLENFDLFKDNPYGWSIDKDIKGGTYDGYYFQYLSLVTISENSTNANDRRNYSNFDNNPWKNSEVQVKMASKRKKPVLGIHKDNNSIVVFKSAKDAADFFNKKSGHITNCCKGNKSSYIGYKWYYLDMNDRGDN